MVVWSSPVGIREASIWKVSTSGVFFISVGASMWTIPLMTVKPGSCEVLEVRVIVTGPPLGVVTVACTGLLAVAPAPESLLSDPPCATFELVTVSGSSTQVASHPSPAARPPSSHSSTPVCTIPSPHTFRVQSLLQSSMSSPFPSSHCSQPGATIPSPQTGELETQLPAWQISGCVHAFPSSHVLPSDLIGFEQVPFAGLQTPTWWH